MAGAAAPAGGVSGGRVALPDAALRRYSRQMLLPEVGGRGQARLRATRVLVVGAGGLGAPAALYLAAAGVGVLGILDSDLVELSNLGRQVLYDTGDVDRPKVLAARTRLEALNPDVRVVPHHVRLVEENARRLLGDYEVVVEGSDDLHTKFVANQACVDAGIPLVVGAVAGWEGQLLVVRPGRSACYRCVYQGEPPAGTIPSCELAGILGPVAGVVGSLEAVAALRLCLGLGAPGDGGTLVLYDGMTGETTTVTVRRDPRCPACGKGAR
jgi:molybdopterin/thiamine biosynthesis adenylyltransferase